MFAAMSLKQNSCMWKEQEQQGRPGHHHSRGPIEGSVVPTSAFAGSAACLNSGSRGLFTKRGGATTGAQEEPSEREARLSPHHLGCL